ncbi:flagella protein [groundwater metagenome]
MLNDLTTKLKKLKMPEKSLIKRFDQIKKASEAQATAAPVLPDISAQLNKVQEEMAKKLEELVSSKAEQIKANAEAVKNLEAQVSKLEQIASSKKGTDNFKERLDKIDETMLELLSLYEVVSSTVNPFVDDKNNPLAEKLEALEKKVENVSSKTPEIPSNLKADYDNKLRTFENEMEGIKKKIEANVIDEEALVEKVTARVLECTRDLPVQKIKPMMPVSSQQPEVKTHVTPQQQVQTQAMNEVDETGARLTYLENNPETPIILLNWIEFLLEKVGRNNLIKVLEYYIEIGWISQEVCTKMMDYANGIDYYVEKPTWKLLPEDHTKSLLFIEQLRGRKMDKNLLSKLERDIDKIIRSSEVLVL